VVLHLAVSRRKLPRRRQARSACSQKERVEVAAREKRDSEVDGDGAAGKAVAARQSRPVSDLSIETLAGFHTGNPIRRGKGRLAEAGAIEDLTGGAHHLEVDARAVDLEERDVGLDRVGEHLATPRQVGLAVVERCAGAARGRLPHRVYETDLAPVEPALVADRQRVVDKQAVVGVLVAGDERDGLGRGGDERPPAARGARPAGGLAGGDLRAGAPIGFCCEGGFCRAGGRTRGSNRAAVLREYGSGSRPYVRPPSSASPPSRNEPDWGFRASTPTRKASFAARPR